jgi:hypothetical protein
MSDANNPLPPSAIERNAVNIQRGVVAVCVLLVLADVAFHFLGHRHTHFAFEGYIGVYAAVGFASYVGLVLSAKLLRKLVMRPEDYYERLAAPEPPVAPAPAAPEPAAAPEPPAPDREDPS